jgi:hypothetical protein
MALVESRFECWVSAPESQASRAALTIRQASLLAIGWHTQRVSRTCERVGRQPGVVVDLTTRFVRGIMAGIA